MSTCEREATKATRAVVRDTMSAMHHVNEGKTRAASIIYFLARGGGKGADGVPCVQTCGAGVPWFAWCMCWCPCSCGTYDAPLPPGALYGPQ